MLKFASGRRRDFPPFAACVPTCCESSTGPQFGQNTGDEVFGSLSSQWLVRHASNGPTDRYANESVLNFGFVSPTLT